jgi:adenosylhomocysteine nucleosidase
LFFRQFIIRWLTAQAMQAAKKEIFKTPEEDLENPAASKQLYNKCNECCESSENQPDDSGTLLEAVDLGIVFAMPMEAAGVVDVLKQARTTQGDGRTFHTGILEGYRVAVVESGVGQENAGRAAEVLLDVFKPKRLLSAGYAGGLAKRLKRFNVCFPEILVRESDGKKLHLSNSVPEIIEEPPHTEPSESSLPKKHAGKLILLTTDFVVGSPKQKSLLNHQIGAELVDMETFAVAEVCRKQQVPFLAIRIILDTAEEQIPKDVQRILKNAEKGGARLVGSVLGSIFSRPSSMVDLFSLKQRALSATDRLAKQIAAELRKQHNRNDFLKMVNSDKIGLDH